MGIVEIGMVTRLGVVMLLLACGALGAHPTEEEAAAEAINQAIDSRMQLDAMQGNAEAARAFADLSPYLAESQKGGSKKGANKLDPWESKTLSAIRGMSQAHLAISTVSADELKFAQDAEEARDVIDQTRQMASIRKQQTRDKQAESISEQLAQAQKSLTEATNANQDLKEPPDGAQSNLNPIELLQEDNGDDNGDDGDGPINGGIFVDGETYKEYMHNHVRDVDFYEEDEGDGDAELGGAESKSAKDFDVEMYSGSEADVEDRLNEAINDLASNQLGGVGPQKNAVDASLDAFAKDTEEAQAAVDDMKVTMSVPTEKAGEDKLKKQDVKEAQSEAIHDAKQDSNLGDAQEAHTIAQSQLAASEKISAELDAAQASLAKAQHLSKKVHIL